MHDLEELDEDSEVVQVEDLSNGEQEDSLVSRRSPVTKDSLDCFLGNPKALEDLTEMDRLKNSVDLTTDLTTD